MHLLSESLPCFPLTNSALSISRSRCAVRIVVWVVDAVVSGIDIVEPVIAVIGVGIDASGVGYRWRGVGVCEVVDLCHVGNPTGDADRLQACPAAYAGTATNGQVLDAPSGSCAIVLLQSRGPSYSCRCNDRQLG